MNLSLNAKVTFYVAAAIITVGIGNTFLQISDYRRLFEKELVERGITLAEALSRSADEGVASENLNFIKKFSDIVHTKDVTLAQIYTTLWLPLSSQPLSMLGLAPSRRAQEHFEKNYDTYIESQNEWFDFYTPVYYHAFDRFDVSRQELKRYLIGYVRLRITTKHMKKATREAIVRSLGLSSGLAALTILLINTFIRRKVIIPIMALQESVMRHKKGELPVEVSTETAGDEIGMLSQEFNIMSRAIREREQRLYEEKERLNVTLRSIGDGVITTDTEGRIMLINQVAEILIGMGGAEAEGSRIENVFHIINELTMQECANPIYKVLKTGSVVELENHTVLLGRDGAKRIIADSASPIKDLTGKIYGVVLVFRDITEKHLLEEERLKTQKLKAIGHLAGGIAHDFNNLLQGVFGYISIAKLNASNKDKSIAALEQAEKALQTSVNLTTQLLTFSKGGKPVKKNIALQSVIQNSVELALSGSSSDYRIECEADLWHVEADEGQIVQVIQNIVLNADQAMPMGGTIVITARNIWSPQKGIPKLREEGNYVEISVQDNGVGIFEEDLPKIFDPYFTTKKKGSGLGLATCYSIINNHEGVINVLSKVGGGTTFYIYLPATEAEKEAPHHSELSTFVRNGKILVMDDDELIRDIAGEMIKALGHEVDFAEHGEAAIGKYKAAMESGKPFDIVILDLTIRGGMGGKDTIERLIAVDSKIRAIVSSGFSDDSVVSDYHNYGFSGRLTKPYNLQELSDAINKLLGPINKKFNL